MAYDVMENYERCKNGKPFTIGDGGFYFENIDECVKFIESLINCNQYFNDEYLFDTYYGIDELTKNDIIEWLTECPSYFSDTNEMIIHMCKKLWKAVK